MHEAGGIDGKGGPPMSPDFTDAVLAPGQARPAGASTTILSYQPPVRCWPTLH